MLQCDILTKGCQQKTYMVKEGNSEVQQQIMPPNLIYILSWAPKNSVRCFSVSVSSVGMLYSIT
jgi:hypothetical protein